MYHTVDLKFDGAPDPAGALHSLTVKSLPQPGHHIRFEDGTLRAVARIEHTLKDRELVPTLILRPVTE